MKLYIDNREPKDIITILKSRVDNIEQTNLELGDYLIKNDQDEIVMIFERKALNDLISSIKDGRYKEQSFRLTEHPLDNKQIYYIIEGNVMNFSNRQNYTTQKMLFSSMYSLSSKKGFSLLNTNGPVETAEFIARFFDKVKTEKPDKTDKTETNNENTCNYSEVLKCSKKSHINKENINEIMLSQIPGISITVANILMNKYNTIYNLIDNLKENSKCLDDLKIQFKNGERKIGKNIVDNLKEFLL